MNYLASCAQYLTGRKTPHSMTPPRGGRLGRAFAVLAALAAFAAAPVQTCAEGLTVATGGEVTEAAGGKDVVHTFRVGTESKTLTVLTPVYAQVLIVGFPPERSRHHHALIPVHIMEAGDDRI